MSNTFPIDWKDIPPNERKPLQILWYYGSRLIAVNNLSAGERCSPNLRGRYGILDKPETTYTVSYYIVASSDGSSAWREIEYTDKDYFDVSSWKISTSYNSKRPIEQSDDRKKGERWQTIMAFNTCTFRTGPDQDQLKVENPQGSISITNIINPDGSSPGPGPGPGPGPSPGGCSSEQCCNSALSQYYTAACKVRRDCECTLK